MRYIKLMLISGLVLFGMLTGLSMLFPANMRVSRAINIAAPRQHVYAAISDLRSWDSWNEFVRSTPLTGKNWSNPSSGQGAEFGSDQLHITLVQSTPDSIKMDWRQAGGKRFAGGFNILQLRADSLTVQWYFDFHFRWYPWEKMASLVYDKKLGPVMEESLSGLKRLMENSPQ